MRGWKIAALALVLAVMAGATAYTQNGRPFRTVQAQIDDLADRVAALESASPGAPTWDSGWLLAPASSSGQTSIPHPLGTAIVDSRIVYQYRFPGDLGFSTGGTGVVADDVQLTVGTSFYSDLEVRLLVWTF